VPPVALAEGFAGLVIGAIPVGADFDAGDA
jgi:hypothetical protein